MSARYSWVGLNAFTVASYSWFVTKIFAMEVLRLVIVHIPSELEFQRRSFRELPQVSEGEVQPRALDEPDGEPREIRPPTTGTAMVPGKRAIVRWRCSLPPGVRLRRGRLATLARSRSP